MRPVIIFILLSHALALATHLPAATLRQLADNCGRKIGAAVSYSALTSDATYRSVLAQEFNQLEPENELKFSEIHPAQNTYNFQKADTMLVFAQANNMAVRGHTFIWHQAQPAWLSGGGFTPVQLSAILQDHINTAMTRYQGKIFAWDVANECFNDDGSLRSTLWYDTPGIGLSGTGYIEQAFVWARAADPAAELYYNDYNIEPLGPKSDAVYAMCVDFVGRGVPIDGIGMQMHIAEDSAWPGAASVASNIARFTALGLKVHITEMDVRVPLPSDGAKLANQSAKYNAMASACTADPLCDSFQLWGFTDNYSWIPGFYPGYGEGLIFDTAYAAKPAYTGVANAFGCAGTPVATSTFTATATPAPSASQLIDDLEDGNTTNNVGGFWSKAQGGASSSTMTLPYSPGATGSNALSYTATVNDWAVLQTGMNAAGTAVDLSAWDAVQFTVRGDGNLYWFQATIPSISDGDQWGRAFITTGAYTTVTIYFDELQQRGFGVAKPFTQNQVAYLQWANLSNGGLSFAIDDIRMLSFATPTPSNTPTLSATPTLTASPTETPSSTSSPTSSSTPLIITPTFTSSPSLTPTVSPTETPWAGSPTSTATLSASPDWSATSSPTPFTYVVFEDFESGGPLNPYTYADVANGSSITFPASSGACVHAGANGASINVVATQVASWGAAAGFQSNYGLPTAGDPIDVSGKTKMVFWVKTDQIISFVVVFKERNFAGSNPANESWISPQQNIEPQSGAWQEVQINLSDFAENLLNPDCFSGCASAGNGLQDLNVVVSWDVWFLARPETTNANVCFDDIYFDTGVAPTPTVTHTRTATPTSTQTPSFTQTATSSATGTFTSTFSPTPSVSPTFSESSTPTQLPSATYTWTPSPSYTSTQIPVFSATPSPGSGAGSGSLAVSLSVCAAADTATDLVFTYTNGATPFSGGLLSFSFPQGWPYPSTNTADVGYVAVSSGLGSLGGVAVNGRALSVTVASLPAGATIQLVFGQGPGFEIPEHPGAHSLSAQSDPSGIGVLPLASPASFSIDKRCPRAVWAFYPTWVTGSFPPSSIPWGKLTHVIYSFGSVNSDNTLGAPGGPVATLATAAHAAGDKVILAIGGASSIQKANYKAMAASSVSRATFINSLEAWLRANQFDGIDIDWEFPEDSTDRSNLNLLVYEMRQKFYSSAWPAPSWIISGDLNFGSYYGQWWDVAYLKNHMDYFNIMVYDMHGSWTSYAGDNSALYHSALDSTNRSPWASGDVSMAYYLGRGLPANQIQYGLAFYGHDFNANELYQNCIGSCGNQLYNYYELAVMEQTGSGWTKYYDSSAQSPRLKLNAGGKVVAYDDPQSIKTKADYALWTRNVAGIFTWELSGDRISAGVHPLLEEMWVSSQCLAFTPTVTRTVTPNYTATATPTISPTFSPVQTLPPNAIEAHGAAPNPNPSGIRVKLAGPADDVVLKIYSAGYARTFELRSGPTLGGWIEVSFTPEFLAATRNGVYFYQVYSLRDGLRNRERSKGKFMLAR